MEDTEESSPQNSFQTRRWLLLVLLCISFAGRGFLMAGFSFSSHIIAQYFGRTNVHEFEVLSGFGFLFAIPMAVLVGIQGQKFRARGLSLTASSLFLLATTLTAIGFMSRYSYWLVILSWIATGLASGVLYITPIVLSDMWFTPDFAPIAFGLSFVSLHIGSAAAKITFQNMNNVLQQATTETSFKSFVVRRGFVGGFGIITLLVFASVILMCVCFENLPSNTTDESEIDDTEGQSENDLCPRKLTRINLKLLFLPFSEVPRVLPVVVTFLMSSAQVHSFLRMPEILRLSFPKTNSKTFDVIYVSSMIAGIAGCSIAMYVSTRFRRQKLQCVSGCVAVLLVSIGLYAFYQTHIFSGIAVCSVILSFATSYVTVTLLVIVLIVAEGADKVTVLAIHFASFNVGMFIFDLISKILSYTSHQEPYILVMVLMILPTSSLILFTNIESYSSHGNPTEERDDRVNETTQLISPTPE